MLFSNFIKHYSFIFNCVSFHYKALKLHSS